MVRSIAAILESCLSKSIFAGRRTAPRVWLPKLEPLESRVLLSGITLADPAFLATGPELQFQQFADFTGDGVPDMLLSRTGELAIWANDGHGKFAPYTTYSLDTFTASNFVVGDFTGDGKPDILFTLSATTASVYMITNLGGGLFGPKVDIPVSSIWISHIFGGDFNNDGALDFVASLIPFERSHIGTLSPSYFSLFLNSGSGSSFVESHGMNNWVSDYVIATGDFDGDGLLDIAGNGPQQTLESHIAIYHNLGDGRFATSATYAKTFATWNASIADFNGDGKLDMAYCDRYVSTRMNNGDGTFGPQADYAHVGFGPDGPVAADLNGDGFPDMVAILPGEYQNNSYGPNRFVVWTNDCSGNFRAGPERALNDYFGGLTYDDINCDGRPDVVFKAYFNGTYFLGYMLNTSATGAGDAEFLDVAPTVTGGQSLPAFQVQLEDGSGQPLDIDGDVSIVIASGPEGGKLAGTITAQAVHGLATFTSVALTKAGTYTLRAATPGMTLTGEVEVQVTVGAPGGFRFNEIPALYHDEPAEGALVLDIVDAGGNVTGDSGTVVTLEVNSTASGEALVHQTASSYQGQVSFQLPGLAWGTYSLSISSPGLTTAQRELSWGDAPPAQLVVTQQPTNGTATAFLPTPIIIQALDKFGNPAVYLNGGIRGTAYVGNSISPPARIRACELAPATAGG